MKTKILSPNVRGHHVSCNTILQIPSISYEITFWQTHKKPTKSCTQKLNLGHFHIRKWLTKWQTGFDPFISEQKCSNYRVHGLMVQKLDLGHFQMRKWLTKWQTGFDPFKSEQKMFKL